MDSKYFQKAVDFRNELIAVIIKKVIEKGGKVKLEQELNMQPVYPQHLRAVPLIFLENHVAHQLII